MYGVTLESDIQGDTLGPLQRLLIMAVNCVKDESFYDAEKAREQAAQLYAAGEAKIGTDEDAFVEILGHAGQRQAYAIFQEYKNLSGITIEQAMENEMSGVLLSGLLAIGKKKSTHQA